MESKIPVTLEGHIERITFQNEEDHFTIAKMKTQGAKRFGHGDR